MIVDIAVYADGRRTELYGLEEVRQACRERDGFAWVRLYEPSEEEFGLVTCEFDLHKLAVEDAIKAHQRPKLEHYEDSLFVVLKSARYLDAEERVEFGEIHVFLGPDFIVTVRHGEASALGDVRSTLEQEPDLLRRGPAAVLSAIVDRVVDDYEPVVDGLENDIEEIEAEVFGGNAGASRRIYELSREVIEFRRAAQPLARVLERLSEGGPQCIDAELVR